MADMRISGLASGMNIDEIVTNLMKAERMPLDKITQKKTYTEWQRDDYRTMNTALSELDTLIFEGIGKQASFNKKTVTTSNDDVLSVTNVNSTSDFSGSVSKVTQLANAATMVSEKSATKIDGSAITITSTTTMENLGILAQPIKIEAIDKDGKLVSYSLDIASTDTLESVINKINADSGVNVFFDEKEQRFSIQAKNTGVPKDDKTTAIDESLAAAIQLTGDLFTNVMKLNTDSNNDKASDGTTITGASKGQNAILTYNGLEIERSSNTFTINGAKLTLKKTTEAGDAAVTFSSTPDVDAIYGTIKKFVDSYNGLIANISEKTSEKKNTAYSPLTDTQREALSDDEIEKWEIQAKKGTLRRDSTLSSLLTKMRTSIYSSVSDSSIGSLAKVGISTTSNYLEGGKLEIDEEKLRAAIEEDPNGIYNLFMVNVEKTVDGKQVTDLEKSGIARRLRADLGAAMKDISTKAGKSSSVNNTFTLGRLLDDYEDKISTFEEKMKNLESRYYKQFNAMESAINKANSQSASLASFFTTS
jgi:flagellar hook-associated protein 2